MQGFFKMSERKKNFNSFFQEFFLSDKTFWVEEKEKKEKKKKLVADSNKLKEKFKEKKN